MSDISCTVAELYVHPIKSCAGTAPQDALLVETGFEFDRAWMVVDPQGKQLTQRQLPRMALIKPTFKGDDLLLRAPGMLTLHLSLDRVDKPTRVRVWDDEVRAYEMGALAAQWFSDYLGQALRLVRFDPEQRRLASSQWTGNVQAQTAFADGYPLLVASTASLADLNQRLAAKGATPVTMQRFRPNVVLDGLQAFDEDHIDEITIDTAEGSVRLRLVKPCVRCSIPNVDPLTAETSHEPGETLATFRADARMDGGLTFGMNAIVIEGLERTLRVGHSGSATFKF